MLKGRLGLESAQIPHRDRHGLVWLRRGELSVRNGTLAFKSGKSDRLPPGTYDIPVQRVSCVILEPGSTVSHDALRLLARYRTGLVVSGDNGVRFYASMPFGSRDSELARRQVEEWSEPERRTDVARRMYAWRLGEVVPHADLDDLRGMEGARMKESYRLLARQHGVAWNGRRYDRENPADNDCRTKPSTTLQPQPRPPLLWLWPAPRRYPSWVSSMRTHGMPSPWTSPTCFERA